MTSATSNLSLVEPIKPDIENYALETFPQFLPFTAWAGHIPFAFWIVEALRPSTFVELGVFGGGSYCAFCQAISNLGIPSACFGIDTWEGDEHAGRAGPELLERLRHHHDLTYGGFSRLIKSTFDTAANYFEDRSIDLLHIDGYHTYEAVRHDFQTWENKLSDSAVVLFHDINVRENNFGVWKLWEELRREHPSFSFLHAHGLGVLGVGRNLPAAVVNLFRLDGARQAHVRAHFSALGRPFEDYSGAIASERGLRHEEIGRYHLALTATKEALEKSEERERASTAELQLLRAENARYNVALNDALIAAKQHDKEHRLQIDGLHTEVGLYHAALSAAHEVIAQADGREKARTHQIESLQHALSVAEDSSREAKQSLEDLEARDNVLRTELGERSHALAERELSLSSAHRRFSALADSLVQERIRLANYQMVNRETARRGRSIPARVLDILGRKRPAEKPHDPFEGYVLKFLLNEQIFDRVWYTEQYPDVVASGQDPWPHFIQHGLKENRSPNPFFDGAWYLKRYLDVEANGLNPFMHYMFFGAVEGRDPSAWFNAAFYVAEHPEAALNPLLYHMQIGRTQGWATMAGTRHLDGAESFASDHPLKALFDSQWYCERYSDVPRAGVDPWRHFIAHGLDENRSPNPFFNGAWYLESYPDVRESGQNPLLHYMSSGAAEGRNPSPHFRAAFYVHEHPEAAPNPLLHFMQIGRALNFPTREPFDRNSYLASTAPAFPVPDLKVSVIVPVYRGLEETQRCLASVLTDRLRPEGEVIVLDDCSPEPELSRWLGELAAAGRIRLLRNPRNIGFVATVNRGMEAALDHDVVLLNSDAEVPEGWLRRLAAQAHSEPSVGTVTPFSNNATICSYPSLPGGPLPEGYSLAALDQAFSSANRGRNVPIPTAVGFAMYIRRDCLDDVGPFDVETFGLGYGEENDFCLRASGKGWRHLLACDTFVYHKGEVSFGENSPRKDRAWEVLVERYPEYPKLVSQHTVRDEAAPFRFAATAALFRASGKAVVLLISHVLGGGTDRHIEELIERTQDNVLYLMAKPSPDGITLSVPVLRAHPTLSLADDQIEDLVAILREFGVCRMHIHHVFGFAFDLRRLVHLMNIPFDFTVHDYYTICPQINLISTVTNNYCGEPTAATCNLCISKGSRANASDIVSWRLLQAWLLDEADRVLCPSNDVARRLTKFGLRRGVVASHEPVQTGHWPVEIRSLKSGQPLRVGLLGVLAAHKGASTVYGCAAQVSGEEIEFVLIGETRPAIVFPEGAPFRETGPYEEADLKHLINEVQPHVLWFPAPWPETYSYTLTAGIASGLPIVASDIGAFPERLLGRPWTWSIPVDAEPETWLATFREVRAAILAGKAPSGANELRRGVEDFYASRYLVSPPAAAAIATQASEARRVVRDLRHPGRIAVLLVPELMENGAFSPCAFIRLILPAQRAATGASVDLTLATTEECLGYRADVLLCQRYSPGNEVQAKQLMDHCRAEGIRVIYDLDDNLLEVSDEHPEAADLREKSGIVELFVREADHVTTSTRPLQRFLSKYRLHVGLLENGLDETLFSTSIAANRESAEGKPVRIMYMGTSTHNADFAFVEPILTRIHELYGSRVLVDLIGVTTKQDLPPNVTRAIVPESAQASYPAFMTWLTTQQMWDIGIAPLIDSPFNGFKSAIKAMDYMAAGAVPLVSDVAAYEDLPSDAVVKARNSADHWLAALRTLIDSPENRQTLREAGRHCLNQMFTLSAQVEQRRKIWEQILADRADGVGRMPEPV